MLSDKTLDSALDSCVVAGEGPWGKPTSGHLSRRVVQIHLRRISSQRSRHHGTSAISCAELFGRVWVERHHMRDPSAPTRPSSNAIHPLLESDAVNRGGDENRQPAALIVDEVSELLKPRL